MPTRTFSSFPVLTTERLTLRQLTVNDGQEIFNLRSDIEINKYLDRQLSNTIDDAGDFINNINESFEKDGMLYWAITLTGQDILVGTICIFNFSAENANCEMGYELLAKFQGQGIMREAAEKVIDHAFHTLLVKTIEACTHRDNQSSIKLLDKLSFTNTNKPVEAGCELICYCLVNAAD